VLERHHVGVAHRDERRRIDPADLRFGAIGKSVLIGRAETSRGTRLP
jgi:hypothetical protein